MRPTFLRLALPLLLSLQTSADAQSLLASLDNEELAQLLNQTHRSQDGQTIHPDTGASSQENTSSGTANSPRGGQPTTRYRPDSAIISPRQPSSSPTTTVTETGDKVDVTGVWYFLHQDNADAATKELDRLSKAHPGWTPPADVTMALAVATARAAFARGDDAAGLNALASIGAFDSCAQPDLAWMMADHAKPALFLTMAHDCAAPIAADSMRRFLQSLPEARRSAALSKLSHEPFSPAVTAVIEQTMVQQDLADLDGAHPSAQRLTEITARVRSQHNAAGAEQLGWYFLHRDQAADAMPWFRSAMDWSQGTTGRAGLARAMIATGNSDGAFVLAQGDTALSRDLGQALVNRAVRLAAQGGDDAIVLKTLDQAATLAGQDQWQNAGWRLLDAHRPALARQAFQQAGDGEQALFGWVLASRQAGDAKAAGEKSCAHQALSPRMAEACIDSLAEEQLTAYEAQDYARAEQLGDRILALSPNRWNSVMLSGWAALQSGHADRAAGHFAQVHDRQPSADSAAGLMQSLLAAGRADELDRRIADGDSWLQAAQERRLAGLAWDRKQFDLAARQNHPPSALTGRPDWSVGLSSEWQNINGSKGTSALALIGQRLESQGMVEDVRLGMSVTQAKVITGSAPAAAQIGHMPTSSSIDNQSQAADVQIPTLTWRREWTNWTADGSVSSTPMGGPVSTIPVGNVAVRHFADPFIFNGEVFSRPIAASMLSYTGLRDPVSGRNWGRVTDNGGQAQGIWSLTDRWSSALTAEAAHLNGDHVADNERWMGRGDLSYDLKPEGMDHLWMGPFVSMAHFEKNLSHYTYGQGGYYSPDVDQHVGLQFDALTAEGQMWQVEAKGSLSYSHAVEAASPYYPTESASSGTGFASSHTDGIGTTLSLRATALVAPQMLVSGFGRYSGAPGYTDLSLGLALTIPFEPREGVVSADLPNSQFAPFR